MKLLHKLKGMLGLYTCSVQPYTSMKDQCGCILSRRKIYLHIQQMVDGYIQSKRKLVEINWSCTIHGIQEYEFQMSLEEQIKTH